MSLMQIWAKTHRRVKPFLSLRLARDYCSRILRKVWKPNPPAPRNSNYSNRFYHRATALLQSSNHNGHALTNDGEIKRFGFGALPRGATGNALLAKQSQRYGSGGGNFLPPANGAVTGYIGFKEQLNAHTYYGWLRIQVDADANGFPDEILLIAKSGDPDIYGAYGLASDDITAGEIASPVPEPSLAALGGLGLLALGARGMREMRRRKTSTAPV